MILVRNLSRGVTTAHGELLLVKQQSTVDDRKGSPAWTARIPWPPLTTEIGAASQIARRRNGLGVRIRDWNYGKRRHWMNRDAKVFVSGHRGLVGSAIVRRLIAGGYQNVLTRSRADLDLLDQRSVHEFLRAEKPDYIFAGAAKVGGITSQ